MPSLIGKDMGEWIKEVVLIDFHEPESEGVSVPMVCQKVVASDGKTLFF